MQVNSVEKLFEKTLAESDLSIKQQRVLKTSLELFSTQGFDRTTSSEIAARAGVAEGTVFKQFKTKQGILNAILQPFIVQVVPMAFEEFFQEVKVNTFANFEAFITYLIKDRMTFAMENQRQIKIFIQEIIRNPQLIELVGDRWQLLIQGNLSRIFDQFKQNGEIIAWSTSRIMQYMASTMMGYVMPRIIMETDQSFDIDQASQEAVAFLMRGLAPSN
ncbi:TetR/AcrR family transcriptional regulator [Lactobacillus sp.] [Lactiplantibacillus mudanjiangensis]|uniref:TetR/AcrR family transcriptional regulator n=1 Tax=Lactiplantibacillus mudanjiangensis TaxID=1296538 RepID=UPI001014EA40|nr:TetR/AcrR family transcriptional regulator [Lactiplantibacillus mudanjiangensis]VDG30833.1 TetR/AcrR family transcriptional regulator [Lactobacillus sp.] [Lactiplantibacillus mudanjiangensis]